MPYPGLFIIHRLQFPMFISNLTLPEQCKIWDKYGEFYTHPHSPRTLVVSFRSQAMVCQKASEFMFYFWDIPSNYSNLNKIAPCITNIVDISTKPTPFYSSFSPPSNESDFISLWWLSVELASLVMLFILQLTHNANSVYQLKNK